MRRSTALLMTAGHLPCSSSTSADSDCRGSQRPSLNATAGSLARTRRPLSPSALIRACTRGRTAILKAKRRPQARSPKSPRRSRPRLRPPLPVRPRLRGLGRLLRRRGTKSPGEGEHRLSARLLRHRAALVARRDPLSGLHPHEWRKLLQLLCSRRVVQGPLRRARVGGQAAFPLLRCLQPEVGGSQPDQGRRLLRHRPEAVGTDAELRRKRPRAFRLLQVRRLLEDHEQQALLQRVRLRHSSCREARRGPGPHRLHLDDDSRQRDGF